MRNKNNDFSSEISYNKRIEKKEIEEIMDDVRENDQCLYYVFVTIILMTDTKEELNNDKQDCYYGINQMSKNINIGKRKKLINGNDFVFGVPGFDKSFFYKMEMGNVFLSGNDEIIIINPMNEYFDIAETYGGTVVNMSTYTDNYVYNLYNINIHEKIAMQKKREDVYSSRNSD